MIVLVLQKSQRTGVARKERKETKFLDDESKYFERKLERAKEYLRGKGLLECHHSVLDVVGRSGWQS